jgi:hypothetical protein
MNLFYLEKGQTINSEYNISLLERFRDEIKNKAVSLDNAPVHKSIKTMAKLHELGYELLPHPPYFPDLALSAGVVPLRGELMGIITSLSSKKAQKGAITTRTSVISTKSDLYTQGAISSVILRA